MTDILVVEDEPDISLMVKLDLELNGYAVEVSNDGYAALEALRSRAFDAVLLDLRIPGPDGWAVLAEIRDNAPAPAPVVIVLSAHASPGTAERALEMGCSDYVTKPFVVQDLRRRLAAALAARGD